MMRIRNYFPVFKDQGEVIAGFGEARLIKFLDGKCELQDRIEWPRMNGFSCFPITLWSGNQSVGESIAEA